MEQLCASFVELEMATIFETVPYDPNDPDHDWVPESNEDDYNCPKPQSSSSLSNEQDNQNRKRQRKKPKSKKRHQEFKIPEPENSPTSPYYKKNKSSDDSDSEDSSREFIKRHRRFAFANSMKDEEADLKAKYLTNSYPSSTETTKTIPTETESNFIIPTHITLARNRQQINNERNKTDYGRRSLPFPDYYGARSSSEGESNSYEFRSPQAFSQTLSFNKFTSYDVMPCYNNHQLLGDSQLLRFSEQFLNCKPFVTLTQDTASRRIGYCVSGQKIKDLEQRILRNELKLSSNLIILIGTNDMVYGTELKSMCDSFDSMLRKLKDVAQRIVILTVPPVPKLDNGHLWKLQQFNQFLKHCADGKKIFLVDLASLYISYSNTISEQYFEPILYKNRSKTKIDLIHLNRNGFKLLKAILDIEYFDKMTSSD